MRRASPQFVNLLGSAILQRLTPRPMSHGAQQITTRLEHMPGRYRELREAFGPAETAADPQHVGRLLLLENDIELNQLRLKWLDRVATVARVRALLDSDRHDALPKHRARPSSRVTSSSGSAFMRARS